MLKATNLPIAIAGIGLLGYGVQKYISAEKDHSAGELSLMTWNVLARPFTKYNRKFHRNVENVEDTSVGSSPPNLTPALRVSAGALNGINKNAVPGFTNQRRVELHRNTLIH